MIELSHISLTSLKDETVRATSSLILFLAKPEELAEAAQLITLHAPGIPAIGLPSYGFLNGRTDLMDIIRIQFGPEIQVACGIMENLHECPVQYAYEIEQKAASLKPGQDDTICLEFCTGEEELLVTTLSAILEKTGIPLIGGTIYNQYEPEQREIAFNGRLYKDACAYALLHNTQGRIKLYNENIYGPTKRPFHQATKVDRATRALIELDDEPAATVYCRELGITPDKILENFAFFPMGRFTGDDDIYISSVREVGPDGTLYNYKQINLNDAIYILELKDFRRIAQKTLQKIRQEIPQVSFIFSIDCIYRYLLFIDQDFLEDYISGLHTLGPHAGVISAGEQYNAQHANQTMVCAVFEGSDRSAP